MKRILIALAAYALYRWWTSPPAEPSKLGSAAALPPPERTRQRAGARS
jgi:hypothetical protein